MISDRDIAEHLLYVKISVKSENYEKFVYYGKNILEFNTSA